MGPLSTRNRKNSVVIKVDVKFSGTCRSCPRTWSKPVVVGPSTRLDRKVPLFACEVGTVETGEHHKPNENC